MRRVVRLSAIFVVMVLLFFAICIAEASETAPCYDGADYADVNIDLDEYGVLICEGVCYIDSSRTATAVIYLDQYIASTGEWENLASWQKSGQIAVNVEGYYLAQTGCRYRARMEVYVYNSNNVLIETMYDEESMYC